jgi:succinate-semialdehyde dehydrogenase/glutarate-semialdehyde dehydrogenase
VSTTRGSAQLADPTLLRTGAYVDGAWLYDGAAGIFAVANPSTGGQLAELPALSSEQVREAIGPAHRAFPGWRALAAKDRSKIIRRWFDLVTEHTEDLAAIITLEEGKPLVEARAEVAYAASFIEWFAEEAKRVRGDVFSAPAASRRIVVLKEPVGVCAAITPWNFPPR